MPLWLFVVVAGMGFEPHDLRVMSPTSYQTALPRDDIAATLLQVRKSYYILIVYSCQHTFIQKFLNSA